MTSAQLSMTLDEAIANLTPVEPSHSLALRPYQEDTLTASAEAYERGVHRQGVALPTGTGKTVVFAEAIRRRGGRALVLAHREELIEQAAKKLHMVAPGLHVGIVKAERDQTYAPVVVGSVQTLVRERRRARLMGPFTTVVVDEAHHAAADSYRAILDDVVTEDTLLLGVSATWDRADKKGLASLFDEIVYEANILDMIEQGYLSDIRAVQVQLAVDFKGLKVTKGDYAANESEKLLETANAPAYALKAYRDHAEGRKALLFAPTVASAQSFANAFADAGYRTASVWGDQPTEARHRALEDFHSGAVQVLTNCAVLTEGYDEPGIDCVIVARPTRSRSLYVQMIGRGTRTFPGKDDLLILDLVGATTRHELVTMASLMGADPKALAKKGAAQLAQEAKAGGGTKGRSVSVEDHANEIEGARIISAHVDVFKRRDLHWGAAGSTFTLSIGTGILSVRPDGDAWCVELIERQARRVIAGGLDIMYAQGVAEDYARQHGAGSLVDPNASWRSRKPSEKQIAAMMRMGIATTGVETAGEASDKLSAAIAGRMRR